MAVLDSARTAPQDSGSPPAAQHGGVRRISLGLALSLLSAVMLFTTFDGYGSLWFFTAVAFVPMYVAQYRLLPRKWSFVAVLIAAFGWWMPLALSAQSVLGLPITVVIAGFFAVVMGLVCIFERPFSERTNYRFFLVQLALVWVGAEVIFQGNLLLGSLYWYAYRLAEAPALIQPVSLVSTPALSFLLIMINAAIALAVLRWIDGRWPQLATVKVPAKTVKWSAVIASVLTLAWVASSFVLFAQVTGQMGDPVRVAMIQSGRQNTTFNPDVVDTREVGLPNSELSVALREQLTDMTRDAASQGAQLVVWPEEAISYDVRTQDGAWIGDLAKSQDITIVVGYMTDYPADSTPNMAAVFQPDGQIGEYYKIHPVIAMAEAFETPQGYPVFDTPVGLLGVEICFDHDFPDSTSRIDALQGAPLMAIVSADPASLANLRWQSVVFRAVENRMGVAKANVGFTSVAVDPNGEVVSRTVDGQGPETQILMADVRKGPLSAPFTEVGGYTFGFLVVAGLLARYGAQIVLRRRNGKLDEQPQAA